MSQWPNRPGRRKTPLERVFGVDWKGFAITAVILLSLAASFLLQQKNKAPAKPSYVPASQKIQQHSAYGDKPRPRSSIEVAPVWGGMGFKPIEEQIEEDKQRREGGGEELIAETPAPVVPMPEMPDLSGLAAAAEDRMQIKKPAGGGGEQTFRGAGGTSGAAVQAEDKPEKEEQEYRIVEGYRKNVTHAHGGGATHRHGGEGHAESGKGHRHKVRYKVPVVKGSIPADVMEKIGIHSVNIYRLEEIARELHEESLRTGEDIQISDQQARDIANEIGLTTGEGAAAPSANPW